MATLKMDSSKVIDNIIKLQKYLSSQGIEWTLVTKMFNGYRAALEKVITHQCMKDLHSVGDSRVSNLRTIKDIKPDLVTMYIKPPALNQAKNIIRYADISLNSSYRTLEALNREAINAGKIHRVIIMIEMGELREGIIRDNILSFYEKVFSLENIKVIGIGTNLGCMYGVEPTYDKLIQLSLYKQLIEAKFQRKLELVSSGSSITLPLIASKKVPKGVNHFRIGETAFLGKSPLNNKQFRNLSTNAFEFSAEILELEKKNVVPELRRIRAETVFSLHCGFR
jgi:predicted amino acid racemase